MKGDVSVNGTPAALHDFVVFENEGDRIAIEGTSEAHLLVLAGDPIGEPVVQSRALRHEHRARDPPGVRRLQQREVRAPRGLTDTRPRRGTLGVAGAGSKQRKEIAP